MRHCVHDTSLVDRYCCFCGVESTFQLTEVKHDSNHGPYQYTQHVYDWFPDLLKEDCCKAREAALAAERRE